ncbi:MAG: hypothetical protein LBQ02_02560 [Candidatus Nomurabacteria bacterium]|jgi:hypothetical protein|nr:hypothetical protein [Candidatus Nomurabacteria bacterium]
MSEFQPRKELEDIKATRRVDATGARERLHGLRYDIEEARRHFADALVELTHEISGSDKVTEKKLTGIIEKYATGLDKETESMFYDGIGSYMLRRRSLKNHLSRVGKEGILEEVALDDLSKTEPEPEVALATDQLLHDVAARTQVTIGPVNYNIFVTRKDFNKLHQPDENGAYKWDKWGGFAHIKDKFPYSVIFMDPESRLFMALFGRNTHSPRVQEVIAHENEHQIKTFVDQMMDEKNNLYSNAAWRKVRLERLVGLGVPSVIIENERRLLLERVKTVPEMADVESLEDVPEQFWRRAEEHRRKVVDKTDMEMAVEKSANSISGEILAYLIEGKDYEKIRAKLDNVYLPMYIKRIKKGHEMSETTDNLDAITKKWHEQINVALKAVDDLKNLGLSTKQVVAMLTPVELSQWAGVVRKQKVAKELGRTGMKSPANVGQGGEGGKI